MKTTWSLRRRCSAQAGVLTYKDVIFTTTWADNVLTLEIDAAHRSGDWTRATMLGALSIKEIGSFRSVSVTAAPSAPSPTPAPAPAPTPAETPVVAPAPASAPEPAAPAPASASSAPAVTIVSPPGAGDFSPVIAPQPEPLPVAGETVAAANGAAVPEPQSIALVLAGLGLMGLALRKRA